MADYDDRRREFLKAAARWSALPLAIAGLGSMAARDGETCDSDFLCSRCGASGKCKLPQAVSFRLERREAKDG